VPTIVAGFPLHVGGPGVAVAVVVAVADELADGDELEEDDGEPDGASVVAVAVALEVPVLAARRDVVVSSARPGVGAASTVAARTRTPTDPVAVRTDRSGLGTRVMKLPVRVVVRCEARRRR
jgi:hypothetical protein